MPGWSQNRAANPIINNQWATRSAGENIRRSGIQRTGGKMCDGFPLLCCGVVWCVAILIKRKIWYIYIYIYNLWWLRWLNNRLDQSILYILFIRWSLKCLCACANHRVFYCVSFSLSVPSSSSLFVLFYNRFLQTQSRFEEESEMLKSNIIEAQRKFIMSTRNRENQKLFFDEQQVWCDLGVLLIWSIGPNQILLMKNTRKNLDKLESERNYCNQQISHYQNILNACSTQIEEFNKQTSKIKYSGLLDQVIGFSLADGDNRWFCSVFVFFGALSIIYHPSA